MSQSSRQLRQDWRQRLAEHLQTGDFRGAQIRNCGGALRVLEARTAQCAGQTGHALVKRTSRSRAGDALPLDEKRQTLGRRRVGRALPVVVASVGRRRGQGLFHLVHSLKPSRRPGR